MYSRLVLLIIFALMMFTNFTHLRLFVSGKSDSELFHENLQRNKHFKCGPSQPRVIKWDQLLDEKDKPSGVCEVIRPQVAVLHKCDFKAGCCKQANYTCSPEEMEEVTLVFEITRIQHLNYSSCSEPSQKRYVRTQTLNDTVCSCQHGHNAIK